MTTGRDDLSRDRASQTSFRDRAPTSPFRALRAHPLIAVAIVLATLGGSVVWLSTHSPSYSAKAQLLITPLRDDDPDRLTLPLLQESGNDPIRTVQTAAAVLDSQAAAGLAAQRLGFGWTRKEVRDAVDVQPQGQTNILDVKATAASPTQAATIANVFAKAIIDWRTITLRPLVRSEIAATRAQLREVQPGPAAAELERRLLRLEGLRTGRDPTVRLSQRAAASPRAEGVPPPLVVALALLAGGLLALGLLPLIDLIGPRKILSEDELLGIYPLPVLSRLPDLPARRRAKPGRLSLDPSVWEAFRSIQVQVQVQVEQERDFDSPEGTEPFVRTAVIMFTSATHADGKTASAIDCAVQLSDTGSDVILVDLDMRKPDVAARLGMTPSPPQPSAPDGKVNLTQLMRPVPGRPKIRVLEGRAVGGLGLAAGFKDLPQRVAALVRKSAIEADYVIVDVPPLGQVSDALLLVEAVTDIVIVARVGNTRISDVEVMRDLLLRAECNPTGYLVIGGDTPAGGYYQYPQPVYEATSA